MKKPTRASFGYSTANGWLHGDMDAYLSAVAAWEQIPRKAGGRQRTTDVHPSWTPYLVHFNPSDPTRSQGAFARWLGVNPATVSGAKRKPISPNMAYDIERWAQSMEG